MHKLILLLGTLLYAASAVAGQLEEPLSNSVRAMMQKSVTDSASPRLVFASEGEGQLWLQEMSSRLAKRMPDQAVREDFLRTVHYEATRAGLGARGFMQVMPFWVRTIGISDHNLFHLRLNLRYGCTILRHYLDIEKGDLYRALGRYNGSLGQSQYPNLVVGAWRKHWDYRPLGI